MLKIAKRGMTFPSRSTCEEQKIWQYYIWVVLLFTCCWGVVFFFWQEFNRVTDEWTLLDELSPGCASPSYAEEIILWLCGPLQFYSFKVPPFQSVMETPIFRNRITITTSDCCQTREVTIGSHSFWDRSLCKPNLVPEQQEILVTN